MLIVNGKEAERKKEEKERREGRKRGKGRPVTLKTAAKGDKWKIRKKEKEEERGNEKIKRIMINDPGNEDGKN